VVGRISLPQDNFASIVRAAYTDALDVVNVIEREVGQQGTRHGTGVGGAGCGLSLLRGRYQFRLSISGRKGMGGGSAARARARGVSVVRAVTCGAVSVKGTCSCSQTVPGGGGTVVSR